MIQRLFLSLVQLFKKDHAKASAAILSAITTITKDLQKVTESASKAEAKARADAAKLLAEAEGLVGVQAKNTVAIANISKLLGE